MKSQYISRNRDLAHCITFLSKTDAIAIDLEFDKNRYRYGFNLCLVQIYADGQCFLIDPLSEHLDIENLFPLLEDPDIEKVTFAFGEDLRLLHSLGCFPQHIFDLKIAASLLNYPPLSLTNLLQEVLDVETEKSSQNSNWYTRPLSDRQRKYAADDVRYLLELRRVLNQEAADREIDAWIREENEKLEQLDYSDVDDSTYIRKKDKNGLSEFEWFRFKQLLEFREELAKRFNRPNYQIIDKNYLKELATGDATLQEWSSVKGIFRKVRTHEIRKQVGDLLSQSAQTARRMELSDERPAIKPLSREECRIQRQERTRINRIKNELFSPIKSRIAEDYGDEAACFMLSNRSITNIIMGNVDSLESYKRALIEDYARELDKNVEPILAAISN